MAQRTLRTLQSGRGIAALVVVLFHANLALSLPKYLGYEPAPMCRFGNGGVQFFFVLSGFVILLAHRKDIGAPSTAGNFLWKRFRRLYPALWLVLLPVLAGLLVKPSLGVPGSLSPSGVLAAFLILPGIPESLLVPEWTLRFEVLFYAAFTLLLLNRRWGIVVLCLALLPSAFALFAGTPQTQWSLASPNHLLFAYGMLVCLLYQSGRLSGGLAWSAFALGGGLLLLAAVLRCTHAAAGLDSLDQLFGVGSALLIAGMVCLERDGHLASAPWLVFLGEASYAVYLIHYPIISIFARIVAGNRSHLPGWLSFLLVSAAGLLGGLAFHVLCERPLLRRLPQRLSASS